MGDERAGLLSLFDFIFEGFDVLMHIEGSLRINGAAQHFLTDLMTIPNFYFEAVRVHPENPWAVDFVVPMCLVPRADLDRLDLYGMSRCWEDLVRPPSLILHYAQLPPCV